MKILKSIIILLSITFYSNQTSCAQSGSADLCVNAEPLCGSNQFYYPNTSGYVFAEGGPNYGCLRGQPNPSWFYLQIAQDGDIQLQIEQSTVIGGIADLDVDFIIYGPFSDPKSPCVSDLQLNKIIDCSYASSFIEYIDIPNTVAGEYYILLITNFSRGSGYISVTQTAGSATTNCVFLNDPTESNIQACKGDDFTLNAITPGAENYIWYEEDGVGNFALIDGINDGQYDVSNTNIYRAEAFGKDNVLLEKFEFNVQFNQKPIVSSGIDDYLICDTFQDNDGIGEFDLSSKDSEILNGLNPSSFSVSYYKTFDDASSGKNPLSLLYANSSAKEIIYTRIDNTSSLDAKCFDIGFFNIEVALLPETMLDNTYLLCVNTNGTEEIMTPPLIDTGLDFTKFSFKWRLNDIYLAGESQSSFFPKQEGNYYVEITNRESGCFTLASTTVNISSPPLVTASVNSLAFSNTHIIEVKAEGKGFEEYIFKLDDGPWQQSSTFSNVDFGEHLLTAKDVNGCGENSQTVMVIDYPRFFTPNADGINDIWNIAGLSNQLKAKVSLFDRYGKLIKQLGVTNNAWNGTYNGKLMAADDYWFVIEYIEPRDNTLKIFKAHFTLKR